MDIEIGTSGYSYEAWRGNFYPQDLPAAKMLAYYAERFSTVEINSTFYQLPTEKMLASWASQVPESFTFVLKASRYITHKLRLLEPRESVGKFFGIASKLGARLGPILFQLPPFQKKDLPRLSEFLSALPEGCKAAFEFRHSSWRDDVVYDALRARNAALCIADTDDDSTPLSSTADWGYLRLRRTEYGDADLAAWRDRIAAQPWTRAYVFFKHEDEGKGPAFAAKLGRLLAE